MYNPGASKWLMILPLALVTVFVVVPVGNIFLMTFDDQSWRLVFATATRNTLLFTLWQAILSTLTAIVIAIPIARVIANFNFIGRKTFISLISVPFILPSVVVGIALLEILPNSLHQSVWAIIIAHVFLNFGLAIRIIGSRWEQIDPNLEAAARTLGAPRLRTWMTVTMPILRGAIINATVLIFVLCFTSYGIVRILGGPTVSTLETEIYFRALQLGDVSGAMILSLVQIIVIGFGLVIIGSAKKNFEMQTTLLTRLHRPRAFIDRLTVVACTLIVVFIVVTPLLTVIMRSNLFTKSSLGDSEVVRSLLTSLTFAAATIILATLAGLCGACAIVYGGSKYKLVEWISCLPIIVSAVSIGLGIIVTFDVTPFDWRGNWLMMPIAHCLIAVPVVIRIIVPVLGSIPTGLRHASQTLGANLWQTWLRIDRKLIRRSVVTAAALSGAISLGEFGASSFLVRRGTETLPLTIARLYNRPGEIAQTQAFTLATILILMCICVIAIIDKFGTTQFEQESPSDNARS